ncbi:MAG: hypothetical protein Q7J86_08670, partial [Bacteroidota bacterium]|nr:hypothetical protein [Bacteroidota bacterium]
IQMLSPENYIRKKVRTLPIYECLVTSEWEEKKMTSVLVARNHTNGNITVCSYLVDLLCLGVKDTMFLFNVPVHQYEEFKQKVNGNMEMTEVDYTLAHNIVYAAIEFAEEFGFKPHKDYDSLTKYMLEEDTEDIELIEIECGNDGKPLYMRGPFEDDAKARKIIGQLEKNAGPGKYDFVDFSEDWDDDDDFDNDQEFDDDDDDEFDDDEDDVNEFSEIAFWEKRELFLAMSPKIDNMDEDEGKRFINLINSLVDDLVDVNQHNKFYDEFLKELNIEVDEDEIPDQLLGIRPGDQPISEELKDRFISTYQLINENPELGEDELKLIQKEIIGVPGVYFLELLLLQMNDPSKYPQKIKEYARIYPQYPLIQILWATEQVITEKKHKKIPGYPFKLETFFPNRETIHPIEQFYTLMLYAFVAGTEM